MKISVLDKGYVELVDMMGDQFRILEAARVSTGAAARKGDEKDRNLIRYLLFNRHTSPFEMVEVIFKMKMPVFVARQHIRHRTAGLNEKSGRYSIMNNEFYFPELERIQKQSTVNKQGSERDSFTEMDQQDILNMMEDTVYYAVGAYNHIMNRGTAKELSRIVLPVNVYTEMFWKIDLHNLFHYLSLRNDPHAQYEIREYAKAIEGILDRQENMEWVMEAFHDLREAQIEFSRILNVIRKSPSATQMLSIFADELENDGVE